MRAGRGKRRARSLNAPIVWRKPILHQTYLSKLMIVAHGFSHNPTKWQKKRGWEVPLLRFGVRLRLVVRALDALFACLNDAIGVASDQFLVMTEHRIEGSNALSDGA